MPAEAFCQYLYSAAEPDSQAPAQVGTAGFVAGPGRGNFDQGSAAIYSRPHSESWEITHTARLQRAPSQTRTHARTRTHTHTHARTHTTRARACLDAPPVSCMRQDCSTKGRRGIRTVRAARQRTAGVGGGRPRATRRPLPRAGIGTCPTGRRHWPRPSTSKRRGQGG